MDYHRAIRIDQQIPKRRQVLAVQRIDDRNLVFGSDLNQAEQGTIRVLGDKLGVERNQRLSGEILAELLESGLRSDIKEFGGQPQNLSDTRS
jgi:hypothetical protein